MMRERQRCAYCHRSPAEGYAWIDGERYCHGDEQPSCYVLAQQPVESAPEPTNTVIDEFFDLGDWKCKPYSTPVFTSVVSDETATFTIEDFRRAVDYFRDAPYAPPRPHTLLVSSAIYDRLTWLARRHDIFGWGSPWSGIRHRRSIDMDLVVAPRLTRFLRACQYRQRQVRSFLRSRHPERDDYQGQDNMLKKKVHAAIALAIVLILAAIIISVFFGDPDRPVLSQTVEPAEDIGEPLVIERDPSEIPTTSEGSGSVITIEPASPVIAVIDESESGC